jgi:phosphoglycolate phosphatase
MPDNIAGTGDPIQVFTYAATTSPEFVAQVEAGMTELEITAAATARPTPHVRDVIAGCRESGRATAIVSNNSARAVNAYLARHDLAEALPLVVAHTSHDPALLKPSPYLIETAVSELGAGTAVSALIGDSLTDIQGARLAGIQEHRLRQQARQARADDRRESRGRHHQHGEPRPSASRTSAAELSRIRSRRRRSARPTTG